MSEGTVAVTISRQIGSGGAQVGQMMATALGFRYADREVLRRAAETLGLAEEDAARREERICSLWEKLLALLSAGNPYSTYVPPPRSLRFDQLLFDTETAIITAIAAHENCVIVGRGGVRVLKEHPRAVHLLLHAPEEFRVRRLKDLYHLTDEQARQTVRNSDEARARYFREMAGIDWMDATNYHLSLDISRMPLEQAAELLVEYVRRRGYLPD